MAVLLKRSTKSSHIPQECTYGCCTTIYGKNVSKVRRSIKRASNADWKREAKLSRDES